MLLEEMEANYQQPWIEKEREIVIDVNEEDVINPEDMKITVVRGNGNLLDIISDIVEIEEAKKEGKLIYKNRFRHTMNINFNEGDYIEVVFRSELYSDDPKSYFGIVDEIEMAGVWVVIDNKCVWFAFSDIDGIIRR